MDVANWLTRIFKPPHPGRSTVCAFCSKPQAEVKKLIAGPGVSICDVCARTVLETRPRVGPAEKQSCSFCGMDQKQAAVLVAGPTSFICGECVQLCVDILDEEDAARAKA